MDMARTHAPSAKRKTITKRKHTPNRLLGAMLLLIALSIVLWVITPSHEEYHAPVDQSEVVAGLEIPMLREGDTLVLHKGFALVYNEAHEQPDWVAYELTRDEVYGIYDRADNFRADPSIATGSAALADYRNSGFDRGHLIPAADLKWSTEALSDSFYLSNMSPQQPEFNRGIWSKLEAVVRQFAATEGSVHVVTGPVLTDGPYATIGGNAISIPNSYYKVILDYQEPNLKAIGFILPNAGSNQPLSSFTTNVDTIEHTTGLDFFPQLPDDLERQLEARFDIDAWVMKEFQASGEERELYSQMVQQETTPTTNISNTKVSNTEGLRGTITGILVELKHEVTLFAFSLLSSLVDR
jgi:endonuclease G, mitochondrial